MKFSNLFNSILDTEFSDLVPFVLRVILIIVGVILIRWVLNSIIKKSITATARRDAVSAQKVQTLSGIIKNASGITLWLLALILILGEIGIKLGPILAAAGVVGIAIGFGAQSLVKDVFNGFFMLLEGQIRIGDIVEAGGKAGIVEGMTLRLLILRDFEGNVHLIPHGEVAIVTNRTMKYSRALIEVGVAYREDPDEVMRVLMEEAQALKNDEEYGPEIIADPEVFGIDDFGDSHLLFKVRFMTKPRQQWQIGRAFRRRVKVRFDRENIEIPFPHRTVYWGEGKDGTAPGMNINWSPKESSVGITSENG